MKSALGFVVVLLFTSLAATPAQAVIVINDWEGSVKGVFGDAFGLGTMVGDTITGTFTYDTDALAISSPNPSSYPMISHTALINGNSIEASGTFRIFLTNDIPDIVRASAAQDEMLAINGGTPVSGSFDLALFDSTGTALVDESLVVLPPRSAFDKVSGTVDDNEGSGFTYSITSLNSEVIPEPSTVVIWSVGLACFGAVARRRRRKRSMKT